MLLLTSHLRAVALVYAFAVTASAQACNPTEKSCDPVSAFGERIECDLTHGKCTDITDLPGTKVSYDDDGALFSIAKDTDEPTVVTSRTLFFGRIDLVVKASPGKGIATSAVLQSATLDEITFGWVGGDSDQVQTNYLYQGKATSNAQGGYHKVSDPFELTHTYSIEWTSKAILWSIDGKQVRKLLAEDTDNKFPQTPMQFSFRNWVAGSKDLPEETVDWAGGLADFSKAPFEAVLQNVTFTDYAGGDKPAQGGIKEYKYSDKSGTSKSVKLVKTSGESANEEDATTSASSTASRSQTISVTGHSTSGPSSTNGAKQDETESSDESKTTDESKASDESKRADGLPAGAIAGIVVGVFCIVAATLVVWFCWHRRRSARYGSRLELDAVDPALPPVPPPEKHQTVSSSTPSTVPRELDSASPGELDSASPGELDSAVPAASEMESPNTEKGRYWVAMNSEPVELDAIPRKA